MDGAGVRGRESEVDADLVCIVDGGGLAGRGVRALQGLNPRDIVPDIATALIDDQAAFGHRNQIAAIPAQQGVAVGAVDAHPASLGRLAVREAEVVAEATLEGAEMPV